MNENTKRKKRILITANTDRHIILCHLPYIKWLIKNGFEVDIATNSNKLLIEGTRKINLNFTRKPISINNIKAFFKLTKILKENDYYVIHTHTPVGSVITRLAYKFSKSKAKLLYTCHGFHFFKGCPIHFWIFFYPIERYLMRYTSLLVVMNKEDFEFAKKHFKKTKVELINGAGFNKDKLDRTYSENEIRKIYLKNDLKIDDFIVSYIAEYSKRKAQLDLIKSLSKTKIKETNIKILLIGDDTLNGKVQKMVKHYHLENSIKTVGFEKDIGKYIDISKIIISVSKQEGLPLNLQEAIYKKKIVIATKCRGNIDLIKERKKWIFN